MTRAFLIAVCMQGAVVSAIAFRGWQYWLASALAAQVAALALVREVGRREATWEAPTKRRGLGYAAVAILIWALLTYRIPVSLFRGGAQAAGGMKAGASDEHADRGVLLRPKAQRVSIVPPVRRQIFFEDPAEARNEERWIPFTGVYWIIQPPAQELPLNSPELEGSPEAIRFHSTDATAILLEAHQKFDPPISAGSLRGVDIRLRVGAGAKVPRMYLVLRNTRLGPEAFVNFGNGDARGSIVRFNQPWGMTMTQCDEMTVQVFPDIEETNRTPAVAVEGFRFLR